MANKKHKKVNKEAKARKKGALYTLDASVMILLSVIILFTITGYITRSNYNKMLIVQPFDTGSDLMGLFQRKGYFNEFYLDNEWFFNGTAAIDKVTYTQVPLRGAANLTTDKDDYSNYWLVLDGNGDYVEVQNAGPIDLVGGARGATVAAWVKLRNNTDYQTVFNDIWSTGGVRMRMDINVNGLVILGANTSDSDTEGQLYSMGPLTINEWHHIAAVFDPFNNNITLYVNGYQNDSTTYNFDLAEFSTDVGTKTRIGADKNGNNGLNGSIDTVLVYNISLNRTDVFQLYNNTIVSHDLVARYDFDPVVERDANSINATLRNSIPAYYNFAVQLRSNQSKIISNSALPRVSSANSFIASAERIIPINDSGRIVDFVVARVYIWPFSSS